MDWPSDAKFLFGDRVQKANGDVRFPGVVVGWYRPSHGRLGYVVESVHEPLVHVYPEPALKPRP